MANSKVSVKKSKGLMIFAHFLFLTLVVPVVIYPQVTLGYQSAPILGDGTLTSVVFSGFAQLFTLIGIGEIFTSISGYLTYAIYAFFGIALFDLLFGFLTAVTKLNFIRIIGKIIGIIAGIAFIILFIALLASVAGFIYTAIAKGNFGEDILFALTNGGLIPTLYMTIISITGAIVNFKGFNKNDEIYLEDEVE